MRPPKFRPFPQPSTSGTSQYVTVTLVGDRIDQIEANGKTIVIEADKLAQLYKDAKAIAELSKQGLEFPHVLALVIRDHLENSKSKLPVTPAAKKETQRPPELKIPEPPAPTEPKKQVARPKAQRYALKFTWSEEASHLNLLTKLSLKKSGKTKKNQIALDKGTNEQLRILLAQTNMLKKIEHLLKTLVRQINHEENLDLQSSDQKRINHSVRKAKERFSEELSKLKQASDAIALVSPASSTDLSSIESSGSRFSLFGSPPTATTAENQQERFALPLEHAKMGS